MDGGPQYPNFLFPGSEYFSLAPNATIGLGGRRRVAGNTPTVIAPASTNAVNIGPTTIQLETNFTLTSGIYLHYFFLAFQPNATGVTINAVTAGLSLSAAPFYADYVLGNPIVLQPIANIGMPLSTDRDRLISAKDLVTPTVGVTTNLSLVVAVSVNNTTTGAISIFLPFKIIYTRLDGLTE
jgi:hypothetical protein